ncbi:hypothetical protein M6B38_117320 [Iris pallida]|uniref:Uncharacterized protein n=1 Tax=Iris pallida TaxID=29817 RepID=A0AAX6HSN9_IRIPA|nr:hypothetical protein M6B38_117320 [Iris pallida]
MDGLVGTITVGDRWYVRIVIECFVFKGRLMHQSTLYNP